MAVDVVLKDRNGNELNVGKLYECSFQLIYTNVEYEFMVNINYLSKKNSILSREEFYNFISHSTRNYFCDNASTGEAYNIFIQHINSLDNNPNIMIFNNNYEFYVEIPLYDENLSFNTFKYREI